MSKPDFSARRALIAELKRRRRERIKREQELQRLGGDYELLLAYMAGARIPVVFRKADLIALRK